MSGEFDLDKCAASWAPFLREFEQHMVPMFARLGYGRDAAIMAYHLNVVHNDYVAAMDAERRDRSRGEEWREDDDPDGRVGS